MTVVMPKFSPPKFSAVYRYEKYEDAVRVVRQRKSQGIPVRKVSDAFLKAPADAGEALAQKNAGKRLSSVRTGGYIFTASHMQPASDLVDKIEFLRGVTRVRTKSGDPHWQAERKKFADVWRLWDFKKANPSLSAERENLFWQQTADLALAEAEAALEELLGVIKSARVQNV